MVLSKLQGAMYPKPLDNAENLRDCGILIYSCNFSDPVATQHIVNKELEKQGIKAEVGIKLQRSLEYMMPGCKIDYNVEGIDWLKRTFMHMHIKTELKTLRPAYRYTRRLKQCIRVLIFLL